MYMQRCHQTIQLRNLEENDFYHLSQEFNANSLDLVKKTVFFLYDYWDRFVKAYLRELNFISHCLILESLIKIINMFSMYRKFQKEQYERLA